MLPKANEHKADRIFKIVATILIFGLLLTLGITYYTTKDSWRKLESEHLTRKDSVLKRRLALGKIYTLFKKLEKEGDQAFEKESYFLSAFKYQQASNQDRHNIKIREKLVLALEKSCASGNSLDCDAISKVKKEIEIIRTNGTEASIVQKRDSVLIQIGPIKRNNQKKEYFK